MGPVNPPARTRGPAPGTTSAKGWSEWRRLPGIDDEDEPATPEVANGTTTAPDTSAPHPAPATPEAANGNALAPAAPRPTPTLYSNPTPYVPPPTTPAAAGSAPPAAPPRVTAAPAAPPRVTAPVAAAPAAGTPTSGAPTSGTPASGALTEHDPADDDTALDVAARLVDPTYDGELDAPPAARPHGRSKGKIAMLGAGAAAAVIGAVLTALLAQTTGSACAAVPAFGARAALVAANRPMGAVVPPLPTSWAGGTAMLDGPARTGTACSGVSLPANRYTVALGPREYADGYACGTYIDVRGYGGTIRAKVTNLCGGCSSGQISLSDEAFIAATGAREPSIGTIKYRAVKSPLVGALEVRVNSGATADWLAVAIDNQGNPLASVEVDVPIVTTPDPDTAPDQTETETNWVEMSYTNWGYWVLNSGAGSGPLQFRVTDIYGHQLVVSGVPLTPGLLFRAPDKLYPGRDLTPVERGTTLEKPSPTPTASSAVSGRSTDTGGAGGTGGAASGAAGSGAPGVGVGGATPSGTMTATVGGLADNTGNGSGGTGGTATAPPQTSVQVTC